MNFELEKSIWTEKDFEIMGWHDSMIHGISFFNKPELFESSILFDIDYIFKWILDEETQLYSFMVSPCTLIFNDVINLNINISFGRLMSTELEIADITLEGENQHSETYKNYSWRIETQRGDITFESSGFKQFVRELPKHIQGQFFDLEERNGVSFDTSAC